MQDKTALSTRYPDLVGVALRNFMAVSHEKHHSKPLVFEEGDF